MVIDLVMIFKTQFINLKNFNAVFLYIAESD